MILRHRLKQKNTLRRRQIVVLSILMLFGFGLTFYFQLGNPLNAVAGPANGDYQSVKTGYWDDITVWQKYNGGWIPALVAPSNADKIITIKAGHTVTIRTTTSLIDQVVVETAAMLELASGGIVGLRKSAMPDLNVYGTFRNAGVINITGGTSITYQNGAKYEHNYTTTAGIIPVGIWLAGSVCEIIGYTTNVGRPTGLNQAFKLLKWNCGNQTATVNFAGGWPSMNGDFEMASTGTGVLLLATISYNFTNTGNFLHSGGVLSLNSTASKTINFTVTGNITLTGGTFNLTSGNNCIGNINIAGDWTHTGGSLNIGGNSSVGTVYFNKIGAQNYFASGIISGALDYTVNSGSILNMGNVAMQGRNFALASGGELGIGSIDGITASAASGNIQVAGMRNYNAGAFYTYNRNGNQNTGDGLPPVINKLNVNNNFNLTLTNSVSVSNVLNLSNGVLITGNKEIAVTNTTATAITGASITHYVLGNLRRTITASGTFAYPLGVGSLQMMTLTTSGLTGPTSILGSFVFANANDTVNELGVTVNGIDMQEILNYGYWTLSPNAPRTGGSYSLELKEQGFSNTLYSATYYSLLSRTASNAKWKSVATQIDALQTESGGVVTGSRSGFTSFYEYALALGSYPKFSSPFLISGIAGQLGAVYLFKNVVRNVNAEISIMSLNNGATLAEIDNYTTGYNESFQPFINFPANKDSYIEWEIQFKAADSNNDTILKKVTATGVDLDGSYYNALQYVREYINAPMPTSYSLYPSTVLTVTNNTGYYLALGSTATIPNIDTSHHEAMYQLNYTNVSSISYRIGAINTTNSLSTRQTSIFFRAFLVGSPVFALPIVLSGFEVRSKDDNVNISWITSSERNNDFFNIERSTDGKSFECILKQKGAGNSNLIIHYSATDEHPLNGTSYYRLKQIDYDGKFSYSTIKVVKFNGNEKTDKITIRSIYPNPFTTSLTIDFDAISNGEAFIRLIDTKGNEVMKEKADFEIGSNHMQLAIPENLTTGLYVLIVDAGENSATTKVFHK